MKSKLPKIILAIILVSLFSYRIVYACLIIEPTIVVKCSNLQTSIRASESHLEGETPEDYQKRVEAKTIENFRAVSQTCKDDLSPVFETFEKEIAAWLQKDKRVLLDGDLVLEPYSIDRENQIQKNKNSLLLCKYEESKHIGNWLIVFKTGRPYCLPFWYAGHGGMCPIIVISILGFLFYLVINLNLTTLPYLAGLILVSGVIAYMWLALLKNRPAMKWWKILVLTLITFVAALFLIIPPFWVFGQVIGWILIYGILALWYTQRKVIFKTETG